MRFSPRGEDASRGAVALLLTGLLTGLAGCSAGDGGSGQAALSGGQAGPTSSSAPTSGPSSASPTGGTRTGATRSASGTPSDTASPGSTSAGASPSPSPSRRLRPPGPPRPATVKGYTLAAAPKGVQSGFEKISKVHKGVFDGVTVRTVRRKGDDLATLILMGVRSDYAGRRAVGQRILPGIIAGMGRGAEVDRRTIGRQPYAVSEPKGSTLVAWYRGGVLVLVLGGDDSGPVVDYSRAYIVAT